VNKSNRIALIGDYSAQVRAHVAIPKALELAAATVGYEVLPVWVQTASLKNRIEQQLSTFDGLWCVPASPYANTEGVLRAIRFARESKKPFLGTCGGFQHAVIEYARNVLGLAEADHAESNPNSAMPLIAPLSCSLVGVSGKIRLKQGSLAAGIYIREQTEEKYHCNFGVNPRFQSLLEQGGLRISGWDENGEARILELEGHPFFMGTLFQPELSAFNGAAHPLITGFVRLITAD